MTSPKPAHETIPNWPPSNWNGGRDQIGIGGRLRWNPQRQERGDPHDHRAEGFVTDVEIVVGEAAALTRQDAVIGVLGGVFWEPVRDSVCEA